MIRLALLASLTGLLTMGSGPDRRAGEGLLRAPVWGTLAEALTDARRTDRPVLVYASAPWCGPCRRMERDVFPAVAPLLDRFALAGLAYDNHEAPPGGTSPFEQARRLGIEATPGFAVLDAEGTLITHVTGALDADAFAVLLAYAATGAYRHASFDAYVRGIQSAQSGIRSAQE